MSSVEFDPEKVREIGPLAVRQLGRLANAIILQQKLGVVFDQSIRIEMGDAVGLLVKCVKGEDSAEKRTTASQEGNPGHGVTDGRAAPAGGKVAGRVTSVAGKRLPGAKPRLRSERLKADPDKSEAEYEIDRSYGVKL